MNILIGVKPTTITVGDLGFIKLYLVHSCSCLPVIIHTHRTLLNKCVIYFPSLGSVSHHSDVSEALFSTATSNVDNKFNSQFPATFLCKFVHWWNKWKGATITQELIVSFIEVNIEVNVKGWDGSSQWMQKLWIAQSCCHYNPWHHVPLSVCSIVNSTVKTATSYPQANSHLSLISRLASYPGSPATESLGARL